MSAAIFLLVPLLTEALYLSDSWSMIASEDVQGSPACVPIPDNLTICKNIEYKEMRLPNLLQHETLEEVVGESEDWKSLLNLNCHSDAQLFLCSIFAPVCLPQLDKAIPPCRSLCQAVQEGCESRMRQYGFPWPEMLRCGQFPEEHDMCIKPLKTSTRTAEVNAPCNACTQVATYENIIDHFCRSQIVLKARIATIEGSEMRVRNARSLKGPKGDRRRAVSDTTISLSTRGSCPCKLSDEASSNQRYLIMANRDEDGSFLASLILPWNKDKGFKRAVRQFAKLNCKSLGREIRASVSRRPHSYYNMRRHNAPGVPSGNNIY